MLGYFEYARRNSQTNPAPNITAVIVQISGCFTNEVGSHPVVSSAPRLSAMTAKPHPFVAAAWFLMLGGLLAADAKVSLRVTTALAALLGLYHGYLNGIGMGQFDTAAVALLGLVFAVFVLIALAAAFVVRLRAHWARIAVRVAGSWIAASGLLMLGWAVRTR